jgi:hypothetical protein
MHGNFSSNGRADVYKSTSNLVGISPPLVGSARNEEPLVDAWVNWSGGKLLVGGNLRKLVRVDTAW